jgi:predicted DNA-binding transcriptional regulator YafY
MGKKERQQRLLRLLENRQQPIAIAQLAQTLTIGTRTIRRDIQELIDTRNAPWFIHQNQVHYDKSIQQRVYLEGMWFTPQELIALRAFSQTLSQLSHGVLKSVLAPLDQKWQTLLGVTDGEADSIVHKLKLIEMSARGFNEQVFSDLVSAMHNNRQIIFSFWHRQRNEKTQRHVSPLQLVRYRDRWLLDAWCHDRQALRSFSLEAIDSVQALGASALAVDANVQQKHFASSYGIFSGVAEKYAVLLFSEFMARWIKDEIWHPQQQCKTLSDGRYQLTLPYAQDIELIQDILKYGAEVEVIEPAELRAKVAQAIQNMASVYASDKICHGGGV